MFFIINITKTIQSFYNCIKTICKLYNVTYAIFVYVCVYECDGYGLDNKASNNKLLITDVGLVIYF